MRTLAEKVHAVQDSRLALGTVRSVTFCRVEGGVDRMSGLAGWVDFRRDVRGQEPVLRSMAGTLACRGPDAEGVWLDAHVGLGHRRLAVLDPAGGAQPMTVSAGDRTVTVATSGLVANYRSLRAELARRGQRCAGESDTEVLARAYLEWGEGCLPRLEGGFAAAIWEHEREVLILARDQVGVKPLYYSHTEAGVVFGSEPKAVLAHPLITPVVDADGLREALAFVHNPGATVFRDLQALPAGSGLRVSREGVRLWRYWQLEAAEHPDDVEATVANVRSMLEESIERQLAADVPVGTLLSGGLDSSAVTALVARQRAAVGAGPVRSFAVDFAGYAEGFTPDAMRPTPDAPFVRELAEYVGAEHTDLVLSSEQLMDPVARAAVARAFDLPVGGDMFTSLYLLAGALRRHATVALCGESADEIFGGYQWFHDQAAWADTFPWLAAAGRFVGRETDPGQTLFRPDLVAKLEVADYQQDSYRAALTEVPHTEETDPTERRMREVSYFHLTRFGPFLFDRQDRMCLAHGLEMRLPLCPPQLVSYVFNTPWAMKTFDGREKSLLRAATRDMLPTSIAEREKSPYPATQDPAYERGLRERLQALLAAGDSPALELVDHQQLQTMLDSEIGAVSLQSSRANAELVLALNDWLTATGARLDLAP
jgi:asparagine synthase (glutamine-hydrolysing)